MADPTRAARLETQDNALCPLLHFVLDDLPTSTKSAELDDTNFQALATAARAKATSGVGEELMGLKTPLACRCWNTSEEKSRFYGSNLRLVSGRHFFPVH